MVVNQEFDFQHRVGMKKLIIAAFVGLTCSCLCSAEEQSGTNSAVIMAQSDGTNADNTVHEQEVVTFGPPQEISSSNTIAEVPPSFVTNTIGILSNAVVDIMPNDWVADVSFFKNLDDQPFYAICMWKKKDLEANLLSPAIWRVSICIYPDEYNPKKNYGWNDPTNIVVYTNSFKVYVNQEDAEWKDLKEAVRKKFSSLPKPPQFRPQRTPAVF